MGIVRTSDDSCNNAAVGAGGARRLRGILSPLASHRLRAVDRWRERRQTYGVGLIRAADRSAEELEMKT